MNAVAYECYDGSGALLYVGVTTDFSARMLQHKYFSPWYAEMSMVKARHYRTASEAAAREIDLLRHASPLHNRDRTGQGTPCWARRFDRL